MDIGFYIAKMYAPHSPKVDRMEKRHSTVTAVEQLHAGVLASAQSAAVPAALQLEYWRNSS